MDTFSHALELMEANVVPWATTEVRERLAEASKTKNVGAIIEALGSIVADESTDAPETAENNALDSMPRRRRGLLKAIAIRKDRIGALDLKGSAVFLSAAVQACAIALGEKLTDAQSPAIEQIAKAIEPPIAPEALADLSAARLTDLFREKSERQIRRVVSIFAHENFRKADTLTRYASALLASGHGAALIDAAAEVRDGRVHQGVIQALEENPIQAEAVILEVLQRDPIEPRSLGLALVGAELVRSERIALALGRRFLKLREHAQTSVAQAILRTGDVRMLDVLECRSFVDEPEELAWAILSLVHGRPVEGKLKTILDRLESNDEAPSRRLRLPLHCEACKETLTYDFEHVFLDLDAKDEFGDPAFVGEVVCKACAAEERLTPTPQAAQIMTSQMLEFLAAAKANVQTQNPLVTPAQTSVSGHKVGLRQALRVLDKQVAGSPEMIRARLQRARILLMLKRRTAKDDLEAVLKIDAASPEAKSLLAAHFVRAKEIQKAADVVSEALRSMKNDPDVRLYDVENEESFERSIEEYVLHLEVLGAKLPEDIDLRRARRALKEQDERAAVSERSSASADAAPRQSQRKEPVDPPRSTGRNDPCPCGSGKKYKKCHALNA